MVGPGPGQVPRSVCECGMEGFLAGQTPWFTLPPCLIPNYTGDLLMWGRGVKKFPLKKMKVKLRSKGRGVGWGGDILSLRRPYCLSPANHPQDRECILSVRTLQVCC